MSATGVGIAIGENDLYLAEVSGPNAAGVVVVTKTATAPLPAGAVVAGQIADPEALGATLRELVKAAKVRPYGMVLAYNPLRGFVSTLTLPSDMKDAEEIESWLRERAATELPQVVGTETATLSWNLTGASAKKAGLIALRKPTPAEVEAQAAAAAAERLAVVCFVDEVETDLLTEAATAAKLAPRAVDLAGVCLARTATRITADDEAVVAIVALGQTQTTIAVRQGSLVRGVWSVPTGIESLTDALLTYLDASVPADEPVEDEDTETAAAARADRLRAQAQALLATIDLANGPTGDDMDAILAHGALTPAADELVKAVHTAVMGEAGGRKGVRKGTDGQPLPEVETLEIFGADQLPGLISRFATYTGLAATPGTYHAELSRRLKADDETDAALIDTYAVAIGAACWRKQ